MLNSQISANPTNDNLNSISPVKHHYQHNQHESVLHNQHDSLHPHSGEEGTKDGGYSLLLEQPTEVLTNITSYLDPPTLLALGQTCCTLRDHVKDDNVWHRAFVCQFLAIGPEAELRADDPRALMMRREYGSWREECVARYTLRRRWARSRTSTVTHIPLHTPVAQVYLLPSPSTPATPTSPSLLSLTLKYGVIARSFPLTGKILPGYLHTQLAPAPVGGGIGNPNAEFSPHVMTCAINSPPNSSTAARVLWGFRNGDVAVMLASRIMDPGRRIGAEMVRCNVGDEHTATVKDIIWSHSGAVSCAMDGNIKVWEVNAGKRLGIKCRWTSTPLLGLLPPEPCVKVAACLEKGIVATLLRNGDLRVWTGLKDPLASEKEESTMISNDDVVSHYIHCPCPPGSSTELFVSHIPLALLIDPIRPAVLVAYANEVQFYRVDIVKDAESTQEKVELSAFGDGTFGVISSISAHFAKDAGKERDDDRDEDRSFVLVGDKMGTVSVFDWSATSQLSPLHDKKGKSKPTQTGLSPLRTFEAHNDGSSVTSLTWNGTTLITGSARGTTHAFDALTFEHLRSFVSPSPRVRTTGNHHVNPNIGLNIPMQGNANPDANLAMEGEGGREPVSQIVLGDGKETLIVVVGERVMAWQAGKVPKSGTGGVRGRHSGGGLPAKKRRGTAKWLEQVEMHETINESRKLLELESENSKRAYGRHKAQTAKLDKLGLSESEALEYVLMLSREEAAKGKNDEARARAETLVSATDSTSDSEVQQAIEEGVFEYDFNQEYDVDGFSNGARNVPGLLSKMPSNDSLTSSTGSSGASSREGMEIPDSRSSSDFPPITPSPSISGTNTPAASRRNSWSWHGSSPTSSVAGTQGSPRPSRSGWGTPLNISASTSPTTRGPAPVSGMEPNLPVRGAWARGSPQNSPPAIRSSPPTRRVAASSSMGAVNEDDMDEDLRFAIELSLAEARSSKEI